MSVAARSITDTGLSLPTLEQLERVLMLRDYNTRVVVLGVSCLGLAAGLTGAFLLLRKRSLTADALSHSMLPGIGIAFMVMVLLGGSGKGFAGLLLGAFASGVIAMGCILLVRHTTRLKDDAAMGIVLSAFFGLGLVLLRLIQEMPSGSSAGLDRFIFGKAASMLPQEAMVTFAAALLVIAVCALLFKEFRLLCFDPEYARAQGWPVFALDVTLMGLTVAVTVVALESVGLLLAVALLIIPSAAARFWTERLLSMTVISGLIGCAGGCLGALISALQPRMPTGPVIVLVCSCAFVVSMVGGTRRGVILHAQRRLRLNRRIARQHLLRTMFERIESRPVASATQPSTTQRSVPLEHLLADRSWTPRAVRRLVRRATRGGLVAPGSGTSVTLTEAGWREAQRVVRNHRLWEAYLVHHADIAPSHVDRDADQVEHVLGQDLVDQLERLLAADVGARPVPESPHVIPGVAPAARS